MSAWLLDTCVIIDFLRDRSEAVDFIHHASDRPAVSAITAAELFAGARTATEERRIEDLLHQLAVHDVDLEVARLGGAFRRRYGQSHGVLVPDALRRLRRSTARVSSPATPGTSRCSTTSWYRTNNRPTAGSRAIIRHADDFRAVHNLESLADLTAALSRIGPRREEGLTTWQGMAAERAAPAPA